ncbi:hypothetical protein KCP76_02245 [Salmonella enterica subsp. enterica serovar Weltevreden]|nr:hypothetical protein KCP76_02245 [Salmonella enterica subsp. enterica serovar Weltevreden]
MRTGAVLLIAVFQRTAMVATDIIWQQEGEYSADAASNARQTSGTRAQNRRRPHQAHTRLSAVGCDRRRRGCQTDRQSALAPSAGFSGAFKAERQALLNTALRVPLIFFASRASIIACNLAIAGNQRHNIHYSITTRCSESEALMIPIFPCVFTFLV